VAAEKTAETFQEQGSYGVGVSLSLPLVAHASRVEIVGNFLVKQRLAASQEGLSYME
jgi:hypothetical protein